MQSELDCDFDETCEVTQRGDQKNKKGKDGPKAMSVCSKKETNRENYSFFFFFCFQLEASKSGNRSPKSDDGGDGENGATAPAVTFSFHIVVGAVILIYCSFLVVD